MTPRRNSRKDWLLLIAWLGALALARSGTLDERDPYWQVRAGMENLAGTPLARPDSWSWAPVEALFYPNSPGWNLALAAGYGLAGFWGLFAVSLLAIGSYLALAVLVARALGARPLPTLLGLLPVLLLSFAWFSPRATIVVQATLLLGILFCLVWGRQVPLRSPMVNGLAVFGGGITLSALGNTLHLSWIVLSAVMALSWTVYWLILPWVDRGRRLALVGGGTLGLGVGALTTPYGVEVGLERAQAAQQACAGLITEWLPLTTAGLPPQWLTIGLAAAAATLGCAWWLVRALRQGQRDARLAAVATITALALPASVAGLAAVRFQGVALLTLAPLAAVAVTAMADLAHRAAAAEPRTGLWANERVRRWTSGHAWRVVLTAVIVLLTPGAVLLALPHSRPAEHAVAPLLPSGCRLFSDPGTSGAILLLRPDVTVFIDGRADYYGRQRLLDTANFLQGRAEGSVPSGTGCIVLPNGEYRGLEERLNRDQAWQRTGAANGFLLWLPA